MAIPEGYKGNLIVSFYQRRTKGIGMVSYSIKQSELYEKDKAEMEEEGTTIFAEFRGVNFEFERKAGFSLDNFDRTRRYKKGEAGMEFILEN